jgi:hypothetical protein
MAGNVLESIYLSIKADTKELRSSLVEVNKRLVEVEKYAKKAAMEVKKNQPAANIASGAIGELTGKLKQLAAAYFSVQGVIKTVNNYLSSALGMGYAAQGMNENIETVNAFGEAVARNGGSIQGFQNSLSNLTNKMRGLRLEGEPLTLRDIKLGITGFNADTTGTEMMLQIADRMRDMKEGDALRLSNGLFDDATVRTLRQGRGEVEKLIGKYKELGVYSQKDFEAARKLKAAMLDLKQSFVYLQTQTMRLLAPALEWLAIKMTAITKWMRDNEQFIRIFFATLVGLITLQAIPAILSMAKAWLAAFAPLLIIGGLIALLIDDFLMWKKHGKDAALFGELWEKLDKIIKDIDLEKLKNDLTMIWKATEGIRDALKDLLSFSLSGWIGGVKMMAADLAELIMLTEKLKGKSKLEVAKELTIFAARKTSETIAGLGIGVMSYINPDLAEDMADSIADSQIAARNLADRLIPPSGPAQTVTNNDSKQHIENLEINIYGQNGEVIARNVRDVLAETFSGAMR